MEIIVSLNPDCIITWSYSYNEALIANLEGRSYKVVGYNPKNISGIERTIISIGKLTAKNSEANSIVANMEARLDAVTDRIANVPIDQRPTVYYEQANGKSVGNGTIGNEVITRAGGKNIYWNVTITSTSSLESPLDANPDFIIIDDASSVTNEEIAARGGWNSINAVQDGHIYRINARMMSITPRIVDAIEQMMEWFYPS